MNSPAKVKQMIAPSDSKSKGRLTSLSFDSTVTGCSAGWQGIADEELGKFRSKFCERKIAVGFCDHSSGWACNFSHNMMWVRRNPCKHQYSPKLCPHILAGGVPSQCSRGSSCQFSHSREEQLFHPWVYKSLPCMSSSPHHSIGTCPFNHGLVDHSLSGSVENLPLEGILARVDSTTSAILSLLELTAESLAAVACELEAEQDPGVFPSQVEQVKQELSLLDCLRRDFEIPISGTRLSIPEQQYFLDTLDSERCVSFGISKSSQEQASWERIYSDIELDFSSACTGYYAGMRCALFRARVTDARCASVFDFFDGGDCAKRNVLVLRIPERIHLTSASAIKHVRIEPDGNQGFLAVFDRDFENARTLADWLDLNQVCSSDHFTAIDYDPANSLTCSTNLLPAKVTESADSYCAALKHDRGMIVKCYMRRVVRAVAELHYSGMSLGGFSLKQFVFNQGSLDCINLLPVTTRDKSYQSSRFEGCSKSMDIWSLGCCAASLLLGCEFDGKVEAALYKIASQCGGLAADFVARCFAFASLPQSSSVSIFEELERHAYFWGWNSLLCFTLKGVANWFQQQGNHFKPNSQRHLINWAEDSFACTKNEGVPARRQVYRVTAHLAWSMPGKSNLVNLVGSAPPRSLRASPLLLSDTDELSVFKSAGGGSRKENPVARNMLPATCLDSHLQLLLPTGCASVKAAPTDAIRVLLEEFHLTERTSVYSFLSFLLFAIGNPHLCMSADAAAAGQAGMLKRHRDVIRMIVDTVPLGLLVAFQLADDSSLVDAALQGSSFTPPSPSRRNTKSLDV